MLTLFTTPVVYLALDSLVHRVGNSRRSSVTPTTVPISTAG
jgi:hypothetical protein